MAPNTTLVILKIGGSVITDRWQERPRLLRQRVKGIGREIAGAWDRSVSRLILIHGAGSFGHPIVKQTGINQGIRCEEQLLALGETQRLQNWLNASVIRYLLRAGLPAFPFQPSAVAVSASGRLVSMYLEALQGLLELGMLPVLYGVPVLDTAQGCSILSGDQLLSFLCTRLGADTVLHGTNVRGVYTSDPFQDREARFLPKIFLRGGEDLPSGIGGSSVTDVTGGLKEKLLEMVAAGAGGQIFDATIEGNVHLALSGKIIGTEVVCPPPCVSP